MSSVEVSKLSKQEIAELSCTYASLILYDDGQDITHDKLSQLISAAGVNVEGYWPKLFAKAIAGKDISSFFNFGGSAASSAPSAPVAEKPAEPAAKDKKGKKEEPKEEPKQDEEEVGMGGLFD